MFFKLLGLLACLFMSNINSSSNQDLFNLKTPETFQKIDFVKEASAELITNNYERDDVFVADIILDKAHGYDIDNTGVNSATQVIQEAIDEMSSRGGGTV